MVTNPDGSRLHMHACIKKSDKECFWYFFNIYNYLGYTNLFHFWVYYHTFVMDHIYQCWVFTSTVLHTWLTSSLWVFFTSHTKVSILYRESLYPQYTVSMYTHTLWIVCEYPALVIFYVISLSTMANHSDNYYYHTAVNIIREVQISVNG